MNNESFDIGNIRFTTEMKYGIEVISPFHHRELGEKNETTGLYPKRVKWADIVINNVPLEKTYEYEEKFHDIRVPLYNPPEREIMINERFISKDYDDYDDYDPSEKWINRMNKIVTTPMTYKDAKKKKKKIKYPVKPKNEYTSEKRNVKSDNYQSIIS